ncbi:uncharacterized protein HaLaN_14952 [Haematococcus lacustris]|uniref:Uncharacterized protein n=1 Tax=Haematococcus lacustris TaxID=44745 RepID=A0A699Z6J4_HAELA|nr:uncharacterized protein HaLaN_14952 [Haematococcus lacustris]
MHVRQDIVSVGVNRVVNAVDWSNSGLVAYGAHTMVALYEPQLLVSGSEDATLRVWQVHASELVQAAQPSTHPQQQPWSQGMVGEAPALEVEPFYALRWSSPGPPPPALKPGARLASLARCTERIAPEIDDEAEAAYT